jgi:hypothetical protein
MFRMAVGHSDDIDLDAALEAVFEQCDTALAGAAPRAGLVLAAWETDLDALTGAIRARYPGIELAGTTTAGEMTSVLGFQEDSIALALFASDAVDITVGLGRDLGSGSDAATRAAVEQARAKTALAPSLCIAMPAIGVVEAGVIIDGLRAALGPGVPVVGGGAVPRDASSNPADGPSRQIADDVVVEEGVVILLFSGPLDYSFGVETGWRGVGPRATVTRSSEDIVMEIDGRPAVEFYERYMGSRLPPLANPLAVFERSDGEWSYLRTPVTFNREAGSIQFFGAISEGASVQLTVAATEEIFEGARTSISDALAAFPGGRAPDAALLYSCATRRFLLGTRAGREVEVVREILGGATPVAGMYCMGELAPRPAAGASKFHNATMVAVLLGSN